MTVKWNADKLIKELARDLENKIEMASKLIQAHMKNSLSGKTHGRHYNEKTNRSSAIDEAPKTQSGNLFNSINIKLYPSILQGDIGSDADYAMNLELGFWDTDTKSYWQEADDGYESGVGPRPFLRPALEKSIEDIKRIFGTNEVIVKWM